KMSRSSDYAFRIGGEEFALVFSGLTMDESSNFLDELRKSVEQTEISHESSDVSDKLTVSIGAKYYSGESMLDSVSIFAHADRSLYTAKKKRNTVIIA
ncbi:MAG: diguanylate cyclase, partial [Spirochaetia bacterium]|nr:diguanylate cyclase [Spirochaetia bacterium]